MTRVAVAGASGFIGTALTAALRERGDDVVPLVRRSPGPGDVSWDPAAGTIDAVGLHGVDVIVNLAGAPIATRWTPQVKRELRDSRVTATRTLASYVAAHPSIALINGSAVGIYGSDRGDEQLTEDSDPGSTFLAGVVRDWEQATAAASGAGARVALARTGIVVGAGGGAAAPLLPLARLGLGGPLGSGRQFWPLISLRDEVRALLHLIDSDLSGPVNLVGPAPQPQRDFARALGARLHRPAALPTPGVALRVVMGEFAADILGSQRVLPTRLLDDGFEFVDPTVEDVAATVA